MRSHRTLPKTRMPAGSPQEQTMSPLARTQSSSKSIRQIIGASSDRSEKEGGRKDVTLWKVSRAQAASHPFRSRELQVLREERVVDGAPGRPVELENRLADGRGLRQRHVDPDRREDLREPLPQRLEELGGDGGPEVVEGRKNAVDANRLFTKHVRVLHEEARLLERRKREEVELRREDELVREVVDVLEQERGGRRTVEDDHLVAFAV